MRPNDEVNTDGMSREEFDAWLRAEDDGFHEVTVVDDPPKEYDDLGTADR